MKLSTIPGGERSWYYLAGVKPKSWRPGTGKEGEAFLGGLGKAV